MARAKRQFAKEFRVEEVELVIDGGCSCFDVARSHDLAVRRLLTGCDRPVSMSVTAEEAK